MCSLSLLTHTRYCSARQLRLASQRFRSANQAVGHRSTLGGHQLLCISTARSSASDQMPSVSDRVLATDEPCIVKMQQMLRGADDVMSLAQGIVHWQPPESALSGAAAAITQSSSYCADDGLPEFKEALKEKLAAENNLHNVEVMVTAGANQAFANVVVSLLDAGSKAVLFAPYYFNHLMALQMTAANVDIAPCDSNLLPDLDALEAKLAKGDVSMVVIVNPCNPTGVMAPRDLLEKAAKLCKKHGAWLVMDNTYEYFAYDGAEHSCIEGDHVINIFSFSKAFGMMGWRIGYIAVPAGGGAGVMEQLFKVQDTIIICPPVLSQKVALGCMQGGGREWVQEKVAALEANRQVVLDALSPLGPDAVGPANGAIYLWVKLPAGYMDDEAVVEWLVKEHGVCLIPGSSCGVPGHVRVAFANLTDDKCRAAAVRLKAGLAQIAAGGGPKAK